MPVTENGSYLLVIEYESSEKCRDIGIITKTFHVTMAVNVSPRTSISGRRMTYRLLHQHQLPISVHVQGSYKNYWHCP